MRLALPALNFCNTLRRCKASSINPNFKHKIIVSLPKQHSGAQDDLLRIDVYATPLPFTLLHSVIL